MAHAKTSSNGKFATLYHMDSKADAAIYAQGLSGLAGKFSQVQAPIYFQLPWEWGLPTTPKKVWMRSPSSKFGNYHFWHVS